jgi:hypothetical protein
MPSEREALGSLAPSAIRASVVIAGARDGTQPLMSINY